MKTRINWVQDVQFCAETETGHKITLDGPAEFGGTNAGPRPMEMLLVGLGGCTAFDVVTILKKARQEIENCEVEIDAERADTIPKVFTRIHIHFIVTGKGLTEDRVERAVKLSADKYCSASVMLAKTAEVTHDFEIRESSSQRGTGD
jgi:putative redox protein